MKYLGCRHIALARADKLIAKACVAILQGETLNRQENNNENNCVRFFDWRSPIAVVGFRISKITPNTNANTNHGRHPRRKGDVFNSSRAVRVLDEGAIPNMLPLITHGGFCHARSQDRRRAPNRTRSARNRYSKPPQSCRSLSGAAGTPWGRWSRWTAASRLGW